MTIHFNADLRPILGQDRVGMLHWVMDPLVSGFVIGYDLSQNQVLICNFDVRLLPASRFQLANDHTHQHSSLKNIRWNPGTRVCVEKSSIALSARRSIMKY